MEITEIEAKYLNRIVKHNATGLTFKITNFITLSKREKYKIEAVFEDLILEEIPIGQPMGAGIKELEIHYEIVGEL